MKLTCKQSDLAKGLSTVSHAVSTRSTLPILGTILVAAESDGIRLFATNLEIGITCRVPATVQHFLLAAVRSIVEQRIGERELGWCAVRCADRKAQMVQTKHR